MHDLGHLLSDQLLVGGLGVASGLHLVGGLLGESNAEHSKDVAVVGLGLDESLDGGVPLLHHGLRLVSGDVHSVEVGVAIVPLNLINFELELSESALLGGVVAVGQGGGENSSSEVISGVDQTGSLVTRGQRNNSLVKSRHEHIVPLFFGEWVDTKQNNQPQSPPQILKQKWSVRSKPPPNPVRTTRSQSQIGPSTNR